MRWAVFGALGAVTLGPAAGCESQADPGYRGEPLLTVAGQVEAALRVGDAEVGILWLTATGEFDLICTGEVETASGAPSACAAACGDPTNCLTQADWSPCVESCPDVTAVYAFAEVPSNFFISGGVGQTTPAVGEFPAQFSLDILEPPPAEALIRAATGERLAIGLFVALDPAGAPWRIDRGQPGFPDWLLGGSQSHLLAFTPDGIGQSSLWGSLLGSELAPGYRLFQLVPEEGEEASLDSGDWVPVPPGEISQVQLKLAPPDTIPWPFL